METAIVFGMHKLFDNLLAPGFDNELCWIGMLPLKVLIHWTRDSVGTKAGNRGCLCLG